MSIKSDKWIRRMAEQYGMIEPFEPGQVRHVHGQRVISYGVSSYGYDVRCADEFKVFTNINSVIVDPKNFDEKGFVDIKGEVCIIPPNSFALARTVEYFRIPRDVLTICLGKSTYARCFRGDTRVALVDGSAPTLEDMARRWERGERFWGYGIGQYGRVMVTYLEAPRFIGRDALLEVELDNGERIHCTPDHQFMRRDGVMVAAHELRPATSLMPLYRQLIRGYEQVYQPVDGYLMPTHRLADDWNIRHGIYANEPGSDCHHLDHDRRNNRPWNITRIGAAEHIGLHNEHSYGEQFDAEVQRALQFWRSSDYTAAREELLQARRQPSDQTRERHRQVRLERYRDAAERQRQSELMRQSWARDDGGRRARQAGVARHLRLRQEIDAASVRRALDETGSIRGAARLLGCDRALLRRFPEVIQAFHGGQHPDNHRVVSIRELPGDHDVYCLTVPEAGNFALEAGVFVHNCGIIVNVTPLEPEWEGHVTLEFSNTTPLPAKIYANEGVAQMLFFESDEECAVSYKDRGGKYMGQRGVTLPKA